ncbi:hypothetical protein CTI12_AA006570 [Artemisia annua]|uniref:Uncharacterized protein n=1 Tax=Artemisia annua TaxID=35608 RepID=A0A2U1QC30_ARTAN|nr:hypothetical protein CTI12_AA006570 [Artemisia annua]
MPPKSTEVCERRLTKDSARERMVKVLPDCGRLSTRRSRRSDRGSCGRLSLTDQYAGIKADTQAFIDGVVWHLDVDHHPGLRSPRVSVCRDSRYVVGFRRRERSVPIYVGVKGELRGHPSTRGLGWRTMVYRVVMPIAARALKLVWKNAAAAIPLYTMLRTRFLNELHRRECKHRGCERLSYLKKNFISINQMKKVNLLPACGQSRYLFSAALLLHSHDYHKRVAISKGLCTHDFLSYGDD